MELPFLPQVFKKSSQASSFSWPSEDKELSTSALAETNDSIELDNDDIEPLEETSSWMMFMWSSSISDKSDGLLPNKSLFMAAFAVSTNHSSSARALEETSID